ncbi:MAG: hypothetical protein KGH57_01100 [Candidatus Micrarchaeota archaeon]|nr:hypothetical protein [Candidatus Micrarchaeota archaeon]
MNEDRIGTSLKDLGWKENLLVNTALACKVVYEQPRSKSSGIDVYLSTQYRDVFVHSFVDKGYRDNFSAFKILKDRTCLVRIERKHIVIMGLPTQEIIHLSRNKLIEALKDADFLAYKKRESIQVYREKRNKDIVSKILMV